MLSTFNGVAGDADAASVGLGSFHDSPEGGKNTFLSLQTNSKIHPSYLVLDSISPLSTLILIGLLHILFSLSRRTKIDLRQAKLPSLLYVSCLSVSL